MLSEGPGRPRTQEWSHAAYGRRSESLWPQESAQTRRSNGPQPAAVTATRAIESDWAAINKVAAAAAAAAGDVARRARGPANTTSVGLAESILV